MIVVVQVSLCLQVALAGHTLPTQVIRVGETFEHRVRLGVCSGLAGVLVPESTRVVKAAIEVCFLAPSL